ALVPEPRRARCRTRACGLGCAVPVPLPTRPVCRGVPAMKRVPPLSTLLLLLVLTVPARADDSGNFIVRLGQDTTSAEHYVRTANRLEVDQVGRAPRTLRRHFTYDMKDGAITHVAVVVTPPGAAASTQTVEAAFEGDSLRVEAKSRATPPH